MNPSSWTTSNLLPADLGGGIDVALVANTAWDGEATTNVIADNQELAPGMSVVTWIPTGDEAEQLVLPADAVLKHETGPFVYVVRAMDPAAPPMAVPTGIRVLFPTADGFVIAPGAIMGGDLVVTEGNERLFPMTPVNPIQPSNDGASS